MKELICSASKQGVYFTQTKKTFTYKTQVYTPGAMKKGVKMDTYSFTTMMIEREQTRANTNKLINDIVREKNIK